MPEFPEVEIPETVDDLTPEHAKLGIVGVAAIVGGFALGRAAAEHAREGDLPVLSRKMTPGQTAATFVAGCIGLAITGKMIKDAVDEYGFKTVALTAGGITVAAVVVRALRS